MFWEIAKIIMACVVGNCDPGKLGLELGTVDVNFKTFQRNYDRSEKLWLEKVKLTSLVFLVKQDSKSIKEVIPL